MNKSGCVTSRKTLPTALDAKTCCFICGKRCHPKGKHALVLVSSFDMQYSHKKAKELGDESILVKMEGHGDSTVDMITKDFRYYRLCMTCFLNSRKEDECYSTRTSPYDLAFEQLCGEISDPLLEHQSVSSLTQIVKKYRNILADKGIPNAHCYKSGRLKEKLEVLLELKYQSFPKENTPASYAHPILHLLKCAA